MNRILKSVAYAFVGKDIDVYIPDSNNDNHFIASRLMCSRCNAYWHMPLLECYLCGDLNNYLYTCTSCGKNYSITNSKIQCSCGVRDSLVKACLNQNCPSNTMLGISAISKKEGGIFELGSSLNLALSHCIKCGYSSNVYNSHRVFIFDEQSNDTFDEFIIKNSIEDGDVVIFRSHIDDKIRYDLLGVDSTNKKVYSPSYEIDKLDVIVDAIFVGN